MIAPQDLVRDQNLQCSLTEIKQSYYYYSLSESVKNKNLAFTGRLWHPGSTVWVRINDNSARHGSIGIAVPKGFDPNNRSNWTARETPKSMYYQTLDERIDIYLGNDKKLLGYQLEKGIQWLYDYTGPATWHFHTTKPKPKYQFTDVMGDIIEIGDFGVYADWNGNLKFGKVTKISKVGMIYVTNMKTDKVKQSYEIRLKNGEQFCRMTKDIFQRLTVMKLSQD